MPSPHLTSRLGDLTLVRIIESEAPNFDPLRFFPGTSAADWEPFSEWLSPHPGNPALGYLTLTMQSYLVRTRRHNILIDTCVGDHKNRRGGSTPPEWHQADGGALLKSLARAGVAPESIDFVLCTHLHADHVGWNTRLDNGRWVPTFRNAQYVISKDELDFWQELHQRKPQEHLIDSVLPIVEAGQARLVAGDYALDDQVWFEPTPGHSAGHVSVRLASRGEQAVVTGDMIHSPVQCERPHWHPRFDLDPQLAMRSRLDFLDRHCETSTLVCGTHFPSPSFGRIQARPSGFRFEYA